MEREHKDYLHGVAERHYRSAEQYLEEALRLGAAAPMSRHGLPAGLVPGRSRVWLAFGLGGRGQDGSYLPGKVFAYFVPNAVEFVAGERGATMRYAEDLLNMRRRCPELKVINRDVSTSEQPWAFGRRKPGVAYAVCYPAQVVVVRPPRSFTCRGFPGLLELEPGEVEVLVEGTGPLSRETKGVCERCGAPAAATRSLRSGGQRPLCGGCRTKTTADSVWVTKARQLAKVIGDGCAGLNLDDYAQRCQLIVKVQPLLHRPRLGTDQLDRHLAESCRGLVLRERGDFERCALRIVEFVRRATPSGRRAA